jgi:hypothetical protein
MAFVSKRDLLKANQRAHQPRSIELNLTELESTLISKRYAANEMKQKNSNPEIGQQVPQGNSTS